MRIWLFYIRNRWQGLAAAGIALLALLVIALIGLSGPTFRVSVLGNANAPRTTTPNGPSGTMLPRSGDADASAGVLTTEDGSLLDAAWATASGPQTLAEAQAAWSANEIAQRQNDLLAAVNCARQQQHLSAVTLDGQLSETAATAWLKLAHDPSFSLMNLPGQYQLRSVLPLEAGTLDRVDASGQARQSASGADAPACAAHGFDAATLPTANAGTRIGIAVFPPQASWDMASAVILVK